MAQHYATDADVELAFANAGALLPPGETGFYRQRQRAEAALLDDLALRWHREEALRRGMDWRIHPMDAARLDPAPLRRACVLKTLELLFDAARAVTPSAEGFERNAQRYRQEYEAELQRLLEQGVRYDWDGSGQVGAGDQRPEPPRRRLVRS